MCVYDAGSVGFACVKLLLISACVYVIYCDSFYSGRAVGFAREPRLCFVFKIRVFSVFPVSAGCDCCCALSRSGRGYSQKVNLTSGNERTGNEESI